MLGRLSLYGRGAVRLHEELLAVAARWTEPSRRDKGLMPYARDTEARTLELLERALQPGGDHAAVAEAVRERLLTTVAQDVTELLPHLETRGEIARLDAQRRLLDRGDTEATRLAEIIEDQRRRISEALGKPLQLTLDLDLTPKEEIRQAESNRRYWERWLDNVDRELREEPARIAEFYTPTSHRIEPVGIAYLWPVTG
jgi:hypothetical protein